MKDIFGRELKLGQTVATNLYGYTDRLVKATVVGFTPQKVKIECGGETILKFPRQLCIKE